MQPYRSIPRLVEAGIDWVTVRATPEGQCEALQRHGYDLVYDEVHRGNKPSAWTYYGYSGVTAGDVSWGTCDRGVLVQVRGPAAGLHWAPLVRLADRVNRLDVMATVAVPEGGKDVTGELQEAYEQAPNRQHRKAQASWVRDSEGGSTFYYGRRGSEHFIRVYNKERESPRVAAYIGCWRYEAELTGETAKQVAAALLAAADSRRACVNYLRTYLTDRSLPCLLPRGDDWRIPVTHVREASDQRALDWLSHVVQPTVRRLLYNGRGEAVRHALGLDDT